MYRLKPSVYTLVGVLIGVTGSAHAGEVETPALPCNSLCRSWMGLGSAPDEQPAASPRLFPAPEQPAAVAVQEPQAKSIDLVRTGQAVPATPRVVAPRAATAKVERSPSNATARLAVPKVAGAIPRPVRLAVPVPPVKKLVAGVKIAPAVVATAVSSAPQAIAVERKMAVVELPLPLPPDVPPVTLAAPISPPAAPAIAVESTPVVIPVSAEADRTSAVLQPAAPLPTASLEVAAETDVVASIVVDQIQKPIVNSRPMSQPTPSRPVLISPPPLDVIAALLLAAPRQTDQSKQ